MKQRRLYQSALRMFLAAGVYGLLVTNSAPISAQPVDFSIGVIGVPHDESALIQAIAESDADNLAFVVADGFKRTEEPCTDQLYQQRMNVLGNAKNGLILSLTEGDWSTCKNADGRSTAVERLSRARELFFVDEFSLGSSKIPVMRQSNTPTFRSYVENARWEVGSILFATMNLPADNNHYRTEAGRNSEFEDRLIADREWLRRTFAIATRKKISGIVLFTDGNPLLKPGAPHLFDAAGKRDGFAEIRQQLNALAGKFSGKVIVIHNRSDTRNAHPINIGWHGNLGDLEVGSGWIKLGIKEGNPTVFIVSRGNAEFKTTVPAGS